MIALPVLDRVIDLAFDEDLAGGDLTTEACVDGALRATGTAVARKRLVACGGDIFARVFRRLDPGVEVELLVAEGALLEKDAVLWRVRGSARSILSAERTALNLTQRMSGVATLSRAYVDALPKGSTTRIADTRKTTPGLRALERYAVRVGGAHNHRNNLGSAVLIKDNHIVAAGGVAEAIARARARAAHTSQIECRGRLARRARAGDRCARRRDHARQLRDGRRQDRGRARRLARPGRGRSSRSPVASPSSGSPSSARRRRRHLAWARSPTRRRRRTSRSISRSA